MPAIRNRPWPGAGAASAVAGAGRGGLVGLAARGEERIIEARVVSMAGTWAREAVVALGERVHAGRGATVGLGCYRIIAGEEGECGSPFVPG